jgi:competence protein ComGA
VHDFIKTIINDALFKKATDIHFILDDQTCVIKMRITESLENYKMIELNIYQKLILFIKYKSNMNLNTSKSPQSSAMTIDGYRVRVSTLPSGNFESIVLRVNNNKFSDKIADLLLFSEQEKIFFNSLTQNSGLILITGPTGSGKTTLTYSILNYLKQQGLSIVTIEDPVERYEQGLVQLQINESAGVNYEVGVKEILRHDPDVIFIGEIRDVNTARSAIRSSLTGHLVISTLHANDCLKAIYRFLEFGLPILDLEQTLLLVTNQRLTTLAESKKIVLEYLTYDKVLQALTFIKTGNPFTYKRIDDYLTDLDHYKVIKR